MYYFSTIDLGPSTEMTKQYKVKGHHISILHYTSEIFVLQESSSTTALCALSRASLSATSNTSHTSRCFTRYAFCFNFSGAN